MKINIIAAAIGLCSLVTAAPAVVLEERQLSGLSMGSTMAKFDLTKGECKGTTFIWARGTTEAPNIVSSLALDTHVSI
jgi:hypothetical protein